MTTPVRYNFDLLMECMKRDNAVLDLTVYTKESLLNSKLHIEGQCSCGNKFSKNFESCYKRGGLFCNNCVILNKLEKTKQTNLKNLGVENPMQSPKIREKTKQTNLKNLGVENPMQSLEVREKIKQTNLRNLGVENPFQSLEVREKCKQTLKEQTGYEYNMQDPETRKKVKQTNLINLGVEHPSQSDIIKEKKKQTNLKNRGVENPFQSSEVREKYKQTNLKNLGVKHPMQDSSIAEKAIHNSYNNKEYIMPSGKICFVQGYEPIALDILLKNISEDDIITSRKDVPELWYNFEDNKHRHYVDIYIPSINKCIEVKSIYTYETDKEKVLAKQKFAKDLGFQYEIWIFDNKKQLTNTIV